MRLKAEFQDKSFFVSLFGADVYAVGGYVRDLLRCRAHEENIDLLIVHHPVEVIIQKLSPHGRVDVVGRSFGVVKFIHEGRGYDIALPRQDRPKPTPTRGHKDFVIHADPDLPIEKDLERRDFRCNSIALQLSSGDIIDPMGGKQDVREKILRLTNPEAFPEDPLRVIRAARFASVLDFAVDTEIYETSKDIDLGGLSAERVNEELFRILLDSEAPSIGLEELFKLGALRQLFPELYRLSLSIQDSVFHPERDVYGHHTVWQHTKITVDQASRLAAACKLDKPEKLTLLLAALYHDVGKATTAQWEFKRGRMVITNNAHDIASEKAAKLILERFKIYSWNGYNVRDMVLALIRGHHRASELWQNRDVVTKKAFNRLAADVSGEIELLIYLDAADRAGRSAAPIKGLDTQGRWLLDKFEELNVSKETIQPLIMGRDLIKLDVPPGPKMGKVLKKIYQMQLDSEFETKAAGLKLARKLIKEAGIKLVKKKSRKNP